MGAEIRRIRKLFYITVTEKIISNTAYVSF